jgi:uncharacterized protein
VTERAPILPRMLPHFAAPIIADQDQWIAFHAGLNHMPVSEYRQRAHEAIRARLDRAGLWVRIPVRVLPTVLEQGRILNRHQVRYSHGSERETRRIKSCAIRRGIELKLLGLPLDAHEADRPVFGYWTDDPDGELGHDTGLDIYGMASLHLSDRLRKRTSVISNDYENGAVGVVIPEMIEEAGVRSWVWLKSGDPLKNHPLNFVYVNTQAHYHGGITLSDVTEAVFHPDHPPGQAVRDAFEAHGIPWRFAGGQVVPPEDVWGQYDTLLPRVLEHFRLPADSLHGPQHWHCVARVGARVVERTPGADLQVLRAFALLHDVGRFSDSHDPEHGKRGRVIAEHFLPALSLDEGQAARLLEAIENHADGLTSPDPVIGACWDADRLDLGRVGTLARLQLMSTAAGRDAHLQRWAVMQWGVG